MASSEMEAHRQGRETLLESIVAALAADERFVAAWLTGSYARGDADAVSDIDLTVVVADEHAEILCRRMEMVTAWPPAERLALCLLYTSGSQCSVCNHCRPASAWCGCADGL